MAILRKQFYAADVKLEANVAEDTIMAWETQVNQYPRRGPAGINYVRGRIDASYHVDCLLCRDEQGDLIGILNRYPADYPPYERAGNVNIWVRPDRRRRGIARALILEALDRWELRWEHQRLTPSGAEIAASMEQEFGS